MLPSSPLESAVLPPDTPLISQPMRVIDTFIAPETTFTDVLRSAACWLPIVLVFVLTCGWTATIDRTVGFDAVVQQQLSKNPSAEERMQSMPPEARAHALALQTGVTRNISYASGVLFVVFAALEALVLWGSFNFGLGAATRYGQVFAVIVFSSLPHALTWLLSTGLLLAGVGTDNFDMRNPVGTNVGYYLSDAPKWLQTGGAFFDVLGLWSLALLVLGMAVIARKSIMQSALIVVGWWVVILLVSTGVSALF